MTHAPQATQPLLATVQAADGRMFRVLPCMNANVATQLRTERYLVELLSRGQELDAYDQPVPAHEITIDVMVEKSEMPFTEIYTLLKKQGWLEEWRIGRWWQDCESEEF